jgi:hypothetical protein
MGQISLIRMIANMKLLGISSLVLFSFGCGVKPSAQRQDFIGIPNLDASSGQVVLSLSQAENFSNVSGYIVGKKELLKLENAGDGKFFVSGVPPGKHDLIVTAETQNSSLFALTSKKVGARIRDLEFHPGKRIERNSVSLPDLKTLTGRVALSGIPDATGIQIFIPGTGYSAFSDAQGQYQFKDIPVGVHNFAFERAGYHRGRIEGFNVQAQSETQTLPDMQMILDAGVEGVMLINEGSILSLSRSVKVNLAVPPDAILMKISENENFEGAAWMPLRTSFEYTFQSDGTKTLFAKIANSNGLESSLFRGTSEIRSQPLTPSLQFVNALCSDAQMTLSIRVSDGAPTPTKMRVSIGSVDESSPWEDFSAEKIISKNLLTGQLTVEVRDAQGNTARETMNSYKCKLATQKGRRNFASAISGSKLFIAGGVIPYPYSWSDELNVLDVSTNRVVTFQLSQARESISTAVAGSKVLFAGGGGNASLYSTVEIYDSLTNSLSTSGALSEARSVGAVAVVGDTALFAGGSKRTGSMFAPSSRVDIYNSTTNTWSQFELSAPRTPASIVLGNKVLFYGTGNSSQIYAGVGDYSTNLVDIYDSSTNTWSQATLSSERHPAAAIVGGKVVFAGGGGSSDNGGLTHVDIFDGATWSTASLSLGRAIGCTAVNQNSAYFIGGAGEPGSKRVDVYNGATSSWSYFDLPAGVVNCEAHVINNQIYIFGLGNGSYGSNQYLKIDTTAGNAVAGPTCPFCLTDPRPEGLKRSFTGLNAVSHGSKVFWPTSALEQQPPGYQLPVDGRLDVLDAITGLWSPFSLAQPRTQGQFFKVGSKGVLVGGYAIGVQSTNHPPVLDVVDLETGQNLSIVTIEF